MELDNAAYVAAAHRLYSISAKEFNVELQEQRRQGEDGKFVWCMGKRWWVPTCYAQMEVK